MNRQFYMLLREYSDSEKLRNAALLEGIKPQKRNRHARFLPGPLNYSTKIYSNEYIKKTKVTNTKYPMRGTYDNGIYYSRRFRVTNTYHKGLAHIITARLNRMFRRRTHQRMPPVKAKRSGTEVYIFVARGNWECLENLLPSIYHTTNIIYKYFEKGCNFK